MDIKRKVKAWNRAEGSISYTIDSLRIRRDWPKPGHLQEISIEELQELTYIPGGRYLLENYILVKDQDACGFLGLPTDPEYFYDENDIKVLLTTGTEDQLLDCLEFAPSGVVELVKKLAVDLRLDSAKKRKIISEHLKINIDAMIRNDEESKSADGESAEVADQGRQRRSAPVTAAPAQTTSKYNVVSRDK